MANKRPSEDKVKEFQDELFKDLEIIIGDGIYAVGDTVTLADIVILARLNMYMRVRCLH